MTKIKIYTEEQVMNALKLAHSHIKPLQYVIDSLTPIELPTDEEIEQEAHIQYPVNLQPNGRTLAGGRYNVDINYSERNSFIECAKWLRNKIQGGNNEY